MKTPRFNSFISKKSFESIFIGILFVATIAFSLRDYNYGFEMIDGQRHSKINNYIIFTNAFDVLMEDAYLYGFHHEKHHDLFKYSPVFAFLMAPFAVLPLSLGLICWNLLNLLLLLMALKSLPHLDVKSYVIIWLIVSAELVGSIMNEQSNGIMSGLIILFLSMMEKNKPFWAISLLILSVYIKLFSLVFLVLLLMYPNVIRNGLYALFWLLFIGFIPVISSGLEKTLFNYEHWYYLLRQDHGGEAGFSLMGILEVWFNLEFNRILFVLIGLVFSLLPLLRLKQYKHWQFRYLYLASWLIWVVIFNHKAESPLFVIAMTGVGLWFVLSQKTRWDQILLFFTLFLVSIAFTDLMPKSIRVDFFQHYLLKAVPCSILWAVIIYKLLTKNFQSKSVIEIN